MQWLFFKTAEEVLEMFDDGEYLRDESVDTELVLLLIDRFWGIGPEAFEKDEDDEVAVLVKGTNWLKKTIPDGMRVLLRMSELPT